MKHKILVLPGQNHETSCLVLPRFAGERVCVVRTCSFVCVCVCVCVCTIPLLPQLLILRCHNTKTSPNTNSATPHAYAQLFHDLKDMAQKKMDVYAMLCHCKYELLLQDPHGPALTSLKSESASITRQALVHILFSENTFYCKKIPFTSRQAQTQRDIGVYWYLFSNLCTRKCIHKRVTNMYLYVRTHECASMLGTC